MFVSKKKFKAEVDKCTELEERIEKLERQIKNVTDYSHRLREYNYYIKLGIDIGKGVDWYASNRKKE